jgi:hypothetical protein
MAPSSIHAAFAAKLPDGIWHHPAPSFKSLIRTQSRRGGDWSASNGMPDRAPHVDPVVEQSPQPEASCEGHRQDQPSTRDGVAVLENHAQAV